MKQPSCQFVENMLKKQNAAGVIFKMVIIFVGILAVISFANPVLAQDATSKLTIKGKLTNAKGEALPGVIIQEKGTTNGVATDPNGEYVISVADSKSVLIFSYVGFKTQEVVVGNQSEIS